MLREETHGQHSSLEQNLPWQEICSNERRYVQLLARFYGFYTIWEPMAESQLQARAREFMQPRRKTSLLVDDLRWFGWGQTDYVSAVRISPGRLHLAGQSASLGSYYVLEGSTLGGQFLSRALERQLGLRDGRGYSYFRSYGPSVADAWVEFGNFLSAKLTTETDVSSAVAAAKATFEVLEEWLTV